MRRSNPAPYLLCRFLPLLVLLVLPVFCAGESGMTFSDEDLERYRKPSDARSSTQPPEPSAPADISLSQKERHRSKAIEVPYTPFEGTARRVIIPVRLNNAVMARMALDTGSPGMIIFERLANSLGIAEKDDGRLLTSAAGIGGTTPAVLTIIDTVQVDRVKDTFVPTVVTESLSTAFDGLIGMDFMANYSIKIDTSRRVVVFEEVPHTPAMPGGHDELWWRSNFREFASTRAAWKQFRASLDKVVMENNPKKLDEIKRFADRQYREADKLFTKLNNYAITHSVPMHWREY